MKWMINLSKPRFIIVFFLLFITCQVLFMLIQPQFLEASAAPSPLDMQPGFTYEAAYSQISQYGEEGVRLYNYFQIVDLFFPLTYAFLFSSIITLVWRKAFNTNDRLLWVNLIPFAGALCDLLENLGIFGMIRIYPAGFETVALLTSISGIIKFACIGITVLLIVSGTSYLLIVRAGKAKAAS
jgi:hypothetical protein